MDKETMEKMNGMPKADGKRELDVSEAESVVGGMPETIPTLPAEKARS